jgi:DNA-binding MarR family transcriptional regulator
MALRQPRGAASPLANDDLYAVFARLVRVHTRLWNQLDARLRSQHAVTLADLSSLEVVAATGGCRVQDLVSTLHITVGGASKVVDRLVVAGYAERAPNPQDRRSSVLTPTSAGLALLGQVRGDVDAFLSQHLATPLSPAGLTDLDRLLRLLHDHTITAPAGHRE